MLLVHFIVAFLFILVLILIRQMGLFFEIVSILGFCSILICQELKGHDFDDCLYGYLTVRKVLVELCAHTVNY